MGNNALSLFSNNFPEFFVMDRDGLGEIAVPGSETERGDATFRWTGPSLDFGTRGRLVRAVAPLGFCAHIATFDDFRIHFKFFTGITDPEVAAEVEKDSTFVLEAAEIDPNQAAFRSVRFPDRHIRHRGSQLFAEKAQTPSDLQDACFRITGPLHPPDPA